MSHPEGARTALVLLLAVVCSVGALTGCDWLRHFLLFPLFPTGSSHYRLVQIAVTDVHTLYLVDNVAYMEEIRYVRLLKWHRLECYPVVVLWLADVCLVGVLIGCDCGCVAYMCAIGALIGCGWLKRSPSIPQLGAITQLVPKTITGGVLSGGACSIVVLRLAGVCLVCVLIGFDRPVHSEHPAAHTNDKYRGIVRFIRDFFRNEVDFRRFFGFSFMKHLASAVRLHSQGVGRLPNRAWCSQWQSAGRLHLLVPVWPDESSERHIVTVCRLQYYSP